MTTSDEFGIEVESAFAATISEHYSTLERAVAAKDIETVLLMLKGAFCTGYGLGMRHVIDNMPQQE